MAPPPSDLAQRVRAFLEQHGAAAQSIGVAVSGGLDSMCLAHLLLEIGYRPAIVHVNHQLRGEESEGDEVFVRAFAEQHRLPFHSTRVDVRTHAERYGLSTQVAARQLRYAFFDELLVQVGRLLPNAAAPALDFLLTAHHADDQVETLLLSLLRGKEWNILGGIPAVRGPYLRPLLTTTRAELEAYQKSNGIAYREDRSNTDEAYLRNKIRHTVLPVLREINPNLTAHILGKIELYEEQLTTLYWVVEARISRAIDIHSGGEITISFKELAGANFIKDEVFVQAIYNLPPPFKGKPETVKLLFSLWTAQVGRRLSFPGWLATRERNSILLQPETEPAVFPPIDIFGTDFIELPTGSLYVSFDSDETTSDQTTERLNANAIIPARVDWVEILYEKDPRPLRLLRLRPWQDGDRYQPLGMAGTQNVSDILTDKKVPSHLRRSYWVLEDAEGIVLLQGHRPAERVKVTEATTRVVKVRWQPNTG